ncbi:hypothetical protein C465_01419 [Halorubrum distributum JCM 9100]|uniref:TRAM domain-containing protein n=1 Tax=Halorubrum distributum JCM 9100 TaxID=1227467 RepID=M0EZM0_9EURY|nr:hypothetical protein C465_01419 [Halorubrum distributum JCM 9100]
MTIETTGDQGDGIAKVERGYVVIVPGEVRDVTIETTGDQGDGIAKVERGYVVIVPGGQPGDEPSVEIEQVKENVAFASIVERDSRAL